VLAPVVVAEGKTVMSIDSSSVSLQLQRLMMEKRMSHIFYSKRQYAMQE